MRCSSASNSQPPITQNPTAASSMPAAAIAPAGRRRMRTPPSRAPIGSATRNSTSTRAALTCEPSATVRRAKIGMSTSAAIRAAPTKKLTRTEPHAGTWAKAPCGTRGAGARRLCRAKSTAGDGGDPEVPRPRGREHLHLRVGRREGQDDPAESDREQPGTHEVRLAHRAPPVAHVDERSRGEEQPDDEGDRESDRDHADRREPDRPLVGERHERPPEVHRGDQAARLPHHQHHRRSGSRARRRRPTQSRRRPVRGLD